MSDLTIPTPAEPAALPRWIWQNVIAATDFSDAGIAALDIAQRIAGRGLVVLHSTQCGKEQQCSHCMARLRLLAPFNESHTLPVEHLVTSGDLTASIASVAQRVHPGLLILGAPTVAIDSGHLDNSTILSRHRVSPCCPVLLVPSGTGRGAGTIDKRSLRLAGKNPVHRRPAPGPDEQPEWSRLQVASRMHLRKSRPDLLAQRCGDIEGYDPNHRISEAIRVMIAGTSLRYLPMGGKLTCATSSQFSPQSPESWCPA